MQGHRGSGTARYAVLVVHAALMVAFPVAGGVLGLLLVVPLLLPLRGLWRGQPYTYAWTSLLIVFYVGACLAEAYAQPARTRVALGLAGVGALEFWLLLLYIRLRVIERRQSG